MTGCSTLRMRRGTTGARPRSARLRTSRGASGRSRASTRFSVGPSRRSGTRAAVLEHCEANGIGDWDLAYAYEALARAHALAGDGEAEMWKSKARGAGDAIADPETREHFDEDYLTLP